MKKIFLSLAFAMIGFVGFAKAGEGIQQELAKKKLSLLKVRI